MKRKDRCPLRHKGSQCAEQEAVCGKKSWELRHVGQAVRKGSKGSKKPQDRNRYKTPIVLTTGLLLLNAILFWGKQMCQAEFRGHRCLIHSSAMTKLSAPESLYSLHSRNPHFPIEGASHCQRATKFSKDGLFAGPWVNVRPWLPQTLHNGAKGGWPSLSRAFPSEALPHQRSACPQTKRNMEFPHPILLFPNNAC